MTFRRLLLVASLAMALAAPAVAQTTRNMQVLAHLNHHPGGGSAAYSACWSYVHSDGREYAVIGYARGTYIYNVTNPASTYLVDSIPGHPSPWREMKSYRNWIYVVTEANSGGVGVTSGMQIIRMTDPENPVLAATYATNFSTSHTVSVDTTRAILICNGTRRWIPGGQATGMRILSLANPEAPVELGWWPGGSIPVSNSNYIHDSVPIGNRLYGSSVYIGVHRIFDFTIPATPIQQNAWNYPGGFTHNSWPDATGNYVYVTDELNGQPLKVFDISNVMGPVLVNAISCNPQAIVHNAHVKGNELYLSNYTEGVRVLDLSDPVHPAEFAWADSWPGGSGGFDGVWEVAPFYPSGTIVVSDRTSGLWVYRPVRDYGLLTVKVIDPTTGDPVEGVEIFLTTQGDSLVTPTDGTVRFAPSPGFHSVYGSKFGQSTATDGRTVSVASSDTIVLELPAVNLTGTMRDAMTLAPLEEAELHVHGYAVVMSNVSGQAVARDVPVAHFEIGAHAPGHVSVHLHADIDPSAPNVTFHLRPTATWDNLETGTPWVVGGLGTGDNATQGTWVRVDPFPTGLPLRTGDRESEMNARGDLIPLAAGRDGGGIGIEHEDHDESYRGGFVQPEHDRTPGGTMCFITGQATDQVSTTASDVDGGRTSLTTPALNMTGMTTPTIAYWRWFYGSNSTTGLLITQISNDNGTNWVPVDTTRGIANTWTERVVTVASHVAPTNQVKLRFVAADLGPSGDPIVEAAIDDLVTYDASIPQVGLFGSFKAKRLAFRTPWPNPARDRVRLSLELPRAGRVRVDVLDLAGRRVRRLHDGAAAAGVVELAWNGADDAGALLAPGVYLVKASAGSETVQTRVVRVR